MTQTTKSVIFSIPPLIQKIIIYSEVHCLTTLYPILFSRYEGEETQTGRKTHMTVMPGLSVTCVCFARQCKEQSLELLIQYANSIEIPTTVEKHQLGLLVFHGETPTLKQLAAASMAVRLYTKPQLNKMLRKFDVTLPKHITEFMYSSQYQRKLAVVNANWVNHEACTDHYCVLTGHQTMAHNWDSFADHYERDFFPSNKIKFPNEEIKSIQCVIKRTRVKKKHYTLLTTLTNI